MRKIGIIKRCMENEKELILSSVEADDKVFFFDSEEELLRSEECENIEIIFGEPDYRTIQLMKNLRWIQMSFAGANKYTSIPDFLKDIILTSASGAYGVVISEYIVSGVLTLTKKFFSYREQMKNGGWSRIDGDDTLEGKRVLILGTGNIGQETAKKFRCFGCYIIGVCRTLVEKAVDFDEVYTIDSLDEQLPDADVVVIALPGTKHTEGLFDSKRIEKMKRDSILVNVGRGFIVKTDDLTDALQKGLIKGAVLDVTEPVQLPQNHPLRNMENVLLTPYISGITWGDNKFTRKRIAEIFCENLKRDKNDEVKRNIVDFGRGY